MEIIIFKKGRTEIVKRRRDLSLKIKYDLSDNYFAFLQQKYPNLSIDGFEQVIREVLKGIVPWQMKDGVLQIVCWNCQTRLSSELNICPSCGIELLSVNTYLTSGKLGTKERALMQQKSVQSDINFVTIMTGLGALGGIIYGLILFQNFTGLFPIILVILGFIELVLVIGVNSRSHLSYIGLLLLTLLSLVVDLLVALALYSTPLYSYPDVATFQETFLGLMIAIILNIAVIFSLLVNGRYFQKGNYVTA